MPAVGYVNINISSEQVTSGTITIYNINGNIMYNRSINIDMGSQMISTQVSTLPSGLYSMQITLDNYNFQKNYKIIIIH